MFAALLAAGVVVVVAVYLYRRTRASDAGSDPTVTPQLGSGRGEE